jgi:hypothetical protein
MAHKKSIKRAGNSRPKKWHPPKPPLFDWRKFDPTMVRGTHAGLSAKNLVTYRDHLDELLGDKGKYVLIVEGEIIGIYATEDEVRREVMARFADQHALVKQIVAKEPMISMGGVSI